MLSCIIAQCLKAGPEKIKSDGCNANEIQWMRRFFKRFGRDFPVIQQTCVFIRPRFYHRCRTGDLQSPQLVKTSVGVINGKAYIGIILQCTEFETPFRKNPELAVIVVVFDRCAADKFATAGRQSAGVMHRDEPFYFFKKGIAVHVDRPGIFLLPIRGGFLVIHIIMPHFQSYQMYYSIFESLYFMRLFQVIMVFIIPLIGSCKSCSMWN